MDTIDLSQIQNAPFEINVKPRDFSGISRDECLYCEDEIPEKRKSYGNITHCIICQDLIEKGLI